MLTIIMEHLLLSLEYLWILIRWNIQIFVIRIILLLILPIYLFMFFLSQVVPVFFRRHSFNDILFRSAAWSNCDLVFFLLFALIIYTHVITIIIINLQIDVIKVRILLLILILWILTDKVFIFFIYLIAITFVLLAGIKILLLF